MQNDSVKRKRLYLLYNPKSGRGTIKSSLSDIVEVFSDAGYEVVVRPTSYSGEAARITEELPDIYDLFVCCGGDGTLNEAVAGNRRRKSPLSIAYIPCGSTNDFGKTLFGDNSMLQVAERIIKNEVHTVDCGKLEEKPFIYTAAFGLFTEISYETPRAEKAILGHAAYVIEAARNLGNIKTHEVKVILDDGEVIEGNFLMGMVTNADFIGGFQNITGRDVSLQDGKIELTMIAEPETPVKYTRVLQALLDGGQNEFVIRRKIKKAEFFFSEPTAFTVDGEFGGTYQAVQVSCIEAAVPLIY